MPRRTLTLAVLATGLALGVYPSPAAAWCSMTTDTTAVPPTLAQCASDGIPVDQCCVQTGKPLRWDRRCISYSLDARGSTAGPLTLSQIDGIVHDSFATWTSVTCDGAPLDFDIQETAEDVLCDQQTFRPSGPNANVIAFVSGDDWTARQYDRNAFAVTTVHHNASTGQIYDVDMELNEQQGPFEICPSPEGCVPMPPKRTPVDLQNVVTHELGHFFGIAHSVVQGATMFGSAARGEITKRTLAPDDDDAICSAYPPGSLPETCDFTPLGGFAPDCGSSGGGCSVARAAAGPVASAGTGPHERGPRAAWALVGLLGLGLLWGRRR
ncbi:MAG: matrixin family metalloprotease, partial [Myxococcales bacterium]|nr:matrixin family metalloprotease [Myxococcales bacterium]